MFEKERMLQNALRLARGAAILSLPIVVTEQYPKGIGPTMPELAAASNLRITFFSRGTPWPGYNVLRGTARPTRFYQLQYRSSLTPHGSWREWVTFSLPGLDNAGFDDLNDQQFYRVQAFRPLTP